MIAHYQEVWRLLCDWCLVVREVEYWSWDYYSTYTRGPMSKAIFCNSHDQCNTTSALTSKQITCVYTINITRSTVSLLIHLFRGNVGVLRGKFKLHYCDRYVNTPHSQITYSSVTHHSLSAPVLVQSKLL